MRPFAPTSKPDIGLAAVLAVFSFGDWVGGARLGSPALAVAGLVPAGSACGRTRVAAPDSRSELLAIAVCCSAAAVLLHATDTGIPMLAALYTVATRRSWRPTVVAWGVTCASSTFALCDNNVGSSRRHDDRATCRGSRPCSRQPSHGDWPLRRRSPRASQSLVDRNAALERERDLLERERELLAREAIAQERARIARELHDVVAHHVSVMVIQAGAAEATLPAGAEQTRATLEAVREAGREALVEMRRLLGVLREPASERSAAEVPTAANP